MVDDPALAVHALAAELDRAADTMLNHGHGISLARYRTLHALRREGPVTQHGLATSLGVGDAVVSRMLPGLTERGWCTVEDAPTHGRRREVRLTDDGAALEAACTEFLAGAFAGATTDAGVDVDRLLADVRAVTEQVRRSMRAGRRVAPTERFPDTEAET